VSQDARQAALFRPAAVTVHDYRKMIGNLHLQKRPGLIKLESVNYHRGNESDNRQPNGHQ
jgi:hypothetical protein